MPGRHHSSQITPRTIVSLGLVVASLLAFAAIAAAEESHPLTADDLVRMDRISDPQVSPDGRSVVYVLRSTDLEADGGKTDLWTVPADGDGTPRRRTSAEGGDWHPRFSPDGKSVHFLSTRSGDPQVWRLPLSGGEALPVTNLPLGVSGFTVTPDGGHLLAAGSPNALVKMRLVDL